MNQDPDKLNESEADSQSKPTKPVIESTWNLAPKLNV